MVTRRFEVPDGPAMQDLGEAMGHALAEGVVVLLSGPLGAGKTTLVQGVARGLEVDEPVSSPSFTLIREYACRRVDGNLIHMDFYRLSGGPEVWALGVAEYVSGDDIVVVEWPERADGTLAQEAHGGVVLVDLAYAEASAELGASPDEATAHSQVDQGRHVVVTGEDLVAAELVRALIPPATVVES